MKTLVLGGSGMAGHTIATYLAENNFEVETIASKNTLNSSTRLIDVTDIKQLELFLKNGHFDLVVNCIGVLVKQSDENKKLAIYLNSYLPRFLEDFYQKKPTRIIHLSTDGVFSGINGPYYENSTCDSATFYGRTKVLGELNNSKDLTIRTSIIGPELVKGGVSLFNWFYTQKGDIHGYTDSVWNGITTLELAKAIKILAEQHLGGICHLTPKETITKFDLLVLLKKVFDKKDVRILPKSGPKSNMTLASTRADFNISFPEYEEMFLDMKSWIENHKHLYKHYEK